MGCRHADYHCSIVSYPGPYAVTRAIYSPSLGRDLPEFIRWSTVEDPPFPCLCRCGPCCDWRTTKAEVDGPIVLPAA